MKDLDRFPSRRHLLAAGTFAVTGVVLDDASAQKAPRGEALANGGPSRSTLRA